MTSKALEHSSTQGRHEVVTFWNIKVPWWLSSQESACSEGDLGSISAGRSLGGGHGNPLQYSCLETPTGRGGWRSAVHGVTKSQPQLSN